jgi:hypothetical protein
MTPYVVEIFDDNGVAIAPGWPGVVFESPTPLPIPNVGEIVDFQGSKWKVNKRIYFYAFQENSREAAVKVNLYCSKAS